MANEATLTLVRGLPGAGKTTRATEIAARKGATTMVSADDHFTGADGVYRFNPSELPQAHAACQAETRRLLESGRNVVVHNTLTQGWEATPYVAMARDMDVALVVVDVYDSGLTDEALAARNVHGVPLAGITAMRSRWDANLLDAQNNEPRAPWER
jgi:predicted kinase